MNTGILRIGDLEVEGTLHHGRGRAPDRFELTDRAYAGPNRSASALDRLWRAVKEAGFQAALLDAVTDAPPVLYRIDRAAEPDETAASLYLRRI